MEKHWDHQKNGKFPLTTTAELSSLKNWIKKNKDQYDFKDLQNNACGAKDDKKAAKLKCPCRKAFNNRG